MPRQVRLAVWLVFFVCLGGYVAGLVPGPYWLDSSEFAAAAATLGIAHPPGHPLAVLLGKLGALVPLGPIAMRVGFASALAGAGAAALVTLLGARLALRVARAAAPLDEPDALCAALLGAAGGLGFGLSYAAAFQAVRPEVYALQVLVELASLHALARGDEAPREAPRQVALAAFLAGLGLANHTLLAGLYGLCAAPFVLALLLHRPGGARWRSLAWAVLGVALALALYAYLPLRALRHPPVDWGAPTTWERFRWVVSAAAFQKSLAHASGGAAPAVVFVLARELALLAPLVPLGLYVLVRLPSTRRLGLALLGIAALAAAAPALVGFDADNPDAYGYLEPALAALALTAASAPAVLVALLRRPWLGRALALAWVAALVASGVRASDRWRRDRFVDTERFAGALLDEAPPRALLVSSYFQSVFALWYARAVEGRRPDVDHVHRHFLPYPGYREELLRRLPELAPLIGARDLDARALARLAGERPVVLEYDLDLEPALVQRLAPVGLGDVLREAPPDDGERRAASARATRRRLALRALVDADEPQTRRVLLWSDYLAAARDCQLGLREAAAQAIARARTLLATPDPDLEALAARCLDRPTPPGRPAAPGN